MLCLFVCFSGRGIWFFTKRGNGESFVNPDNTLDSSNSLFFDEIKGEWMNAEKIWSDHRFLSSGRPRPDNRNRACLVKINDNTLAYLGGVPAPKIPGQKKKVTYPNFGKMIDTYNLDTKEEKDEVAQMEFERKHFSCALIPNSQSGNPTVAICKRTLFYQEYLKRECQKVSLTYP